MNTNRKTRLSQLYITFFAVLVLFEVIVSERQLSSAKIQPVMSVVNLAQIDLNSDTIVSQPIDYKVEDAVKQLTIMQAKDKRYARIVKNQDKYPDRLLINLANNPELLTFVLEYPQKTEINENISLSTPEMTSACPLFLQWDTRWGYQTYGDNNIACSGCGPTALSMVVVGLTHNAKATPARIAEYATQNDFYEKGIGTKWELMDEGPALFGLTSETAPTEEIIMKQLLDEGKLLIASMNKGDFTTAGHFIVICGYSQEGFQIRDPFCIYRSNQTWAYTSLNQQMESLWAIGLP